MMLGKIFGKVTTSEFKFVVDIDVKKFDYVQVYHKFYEFVLCQVVEVEKKETLTTALCQVIGYKDKKTNTIKKLRIPFEPGTEVLKAQEEFIASIIQVEHTNESAYMGKLDGTNIPLHINLRQLLTKHVAVLAKSGSGKSYTVGVLLEEIIDKGVPLLVIDPHGEYSTLQQKNTNEKDLSAMPLFGIEPKEFSVQEYGDEKLNPRLRPLRLPDSFTAQELLQTIPVKLSNAQQGILYSAMQSKELDINSILQAIASEESNLKWSVQTAIEQVLKTGLFSIAPQPYEQFLKSKTCSIINLKGIPPWLQEVIVYKISKDLFELRKQNKVPPFFLVVEEAHNYCPERSFGTKKSSGILRTIASEGRKFGLGLCVISQRPARVDKSVLSQCSTQILLKVTNPNDLKAISSSVEGITSATEKELQNLPVGTALITGVTDVPLFVKIRPRKTQHGGEAVDILGSSERLGSLEGEEQNSHLPVYEVSEDKNINQRAAFSEQNNERDVLNFDIGSDNSSDNNNSNDDSNIIFNNDSDMYSNNDSNINPNSNSNGNSNDDSSIHSTTHSNKDFFEQLDEFKQKEVLPLIKPVMTLKEVLLVADEDVKDVTTTLIPIYVFTFLEKSSDETSYQLLFDRTTKGFITNKELNKQKHIPSFDGFDKNDLLILQIIYDKKTFSQEQLYILAQEKFNLSESVIGLSIDKLREQNFIKEHFDGISKIYVLSDEFIFDELRVCAQYETIRYESIHYSEKQEAKYNQDDLRELLPEGEIQDIQEAYLVVFKEVR